MNTFNKKIVALLLGLWLPATFSMNVQAQSSTMDYFNSGGLVKQVRMINGKVLILSHSGTAHRMSLLSTYPLQSQGATAAAKTFTNNFTPTVDASIVDFAVDGNMVYTIGEKNGEVYIGSCDINTIYGGGNYTIHSIPSGALMMTPGEQISHNYTFHSPHRIEVFTDGSNGDLHALILCEVTDLLWHIILNQPWDTNYYQCMVDVNITAGYSLRVYTSNTEVYDDIAVTSNAVVISGRKPSAMSAVLWAYHKNGFALGNVRSQFTLNTDSVIEKTHILALNDDYIAMAYYRSAPTNLWLLRLSLSIGSTISATMQNDVCRTKSYGFYSWTYLTDYNRLCILDKGDLDNGLSAQVVSIFQWNYSGSLPAYYKDVADQEVIYAYDGSHFGVAGNILDGSLDGIRLYYQDPYQANSCWEQDFVTIGDKKARRDPDSSIPTAITWSTVNVSYTPTILNHKIQNECYEQ